MTPSCCARALALAALLLTGCPSAHGGDAGAAGYDACVMPSECVVVPASCCGGCGAARRGDAVAGNVGRADAYRGRGCGGDPTRVLLAPRPHARRDVRGRPLRSRRSRAALGERVRRFIRLPRARERVLRVRRDCLREHGGRRLERGRVRRARLRSGHRLPGVRPGVSRRVRRELRGRPLRHGLRRPPVNAARAHATEPWPLGCARAIAVAGRTR